MHHRVRLNFPTLIYHHSKVCFLASDAWASLPSNFLHLGCVSHSCFLFSCVSSFPAPLHSCFLMATSYVLLHSALKKAPALWDTSLCDALSNPTIVSQVEEADVFLVRSSFYLFRFFYLWFGLYSPLIVLHILDPFLMLLIDFMPPCRVLLTNSWFVFRRLTGRHGCLALMRLPTF